MPEGEEMFNFHGYSGPCPRPPLPRGPTKDEEIAKLKAELAEAQEQITPVPRSVVIDRLQAELAAAREEIAKLKPDAERWNRLCDLWAASNELALMQEPDGRWSIKQVEDVDGEMFYQLIGDTPDAAIDAAREEPKT